NQSARPTPYRPPARFDFRLQHLARWLPRGFQCLGAPWTIAPKLTRHAPAARLAFFLGTGQRPFSLDFRLAPRAVSHERHQIAARTTRVMTFGRVTEVAV